MMSWLEDVWPLIVLCACVLLFFWGRSRGRTNLANMLAQARAEGHATAQAELRSLQMVNVVAGNSGLSRSDGELSHAEDRQAAALARLVALSGPAGAGLVGGDVRDLRQETADDCLSRAGLIPEEWVLRDVVHLPSVAPGGDDDYYGADFDDDASRVHRRRTPDWLRSVADRPGGWDASDSGASPERVRPHPSTGLGRGPGA